MEIENTRSNETSLGALPAGSAARPKVRSEGQSSPSGAQAESGDWQSVVPPVSQCCVVCVCVGGGEVECRSSETSLGALPAGSAARPKVRSEGQSSPSGAQAESGDWQSVVPPVS